MSCRSQLLESNLLGNSWSATFHLNRCEKVKGVDLIHETRVKAPYASHTETKPPGHTIACQSSRCKVCPLVQLDSFTFTGAFSNKLYGTVNHSHKPIICICLTDNVIYMITCSVCKLQYIGQTKNELKTRIHQHLGKIDKYKNHDTPEDEKTQVVYRHFEKCNGKPLVRIVERMETTNTTNKSNK